MNSQIFYNHVPPFNVSKITINSNEVIDNAIFVAIKGINHDGHDYVEQAIKKGAKIIVTTKIVETTADVHNIVVKNTNYELARISALFYETNCFNTNFIGITGTDGKTTTALITKQLLNNSGYIGTNGIIYQNTKITPKLTTPIAPDLHNYFAKMREEKVENIVMEVSSHARVLFRDAFINYQVAAFTNLTHDHLDFHLTMEAYFEAKATLFKSLSAKSYAVINLDDQYGQKLLDLTNAAIITYGINNEQANLNAINLQQTPQGTKFDLIYRNIKYQVISPLIGEFNVANLLCAIGINLALQNESIEQIIEKIKLLQSVEGRLEVINQDQDFTVIVDFAHTPNAISKILTLGNKLKANQKLITVSGSAGLRDTAKRPIIGEMLITKSDLAIITTDDPYTEDPVQIANQMVGKHQNANNYQVIIDRFAAIKAAINYAQKGDIVLILGRGHETKLPINNQLINFDDRIVCQTILKERNKQDE